MLIVQRAEVSNNAEEIIPSSDNVHSQQIVNASIIKMDFRV